MGTERVGMGGICGRNGCLTKEGDVGVFRIPADGAAWGGAVNRVPGGKVDQAEDGGGKLGRHVENFNPLS